MNDITRDERRRLIMQVKFLRDLNPTTALLAQNWINCPQCLKERPSAQPPNRWARLSIGTTPRGLQVWCVRHDCNVAHITVTAEA